MLRQDTFICIAIACINNDMTSSGLYDDDDDDNNNITECFQNSF